jgi:hypothetical protein
MQYDKESHVMFTPDFPMRESFSGMIFEVNPLCGVWSWWYSFGDALAELLISNLLSLILV